MSFLSAKSNLINEMFLTKEFINLKNAKIRLNQNSEYFTQVRDFQKKLQDLENSQTNLEYYNEQMQRLRSEYEQLAKKPEIANYFQASAALTSLVEKLVEDINTAVDSNLR